MVTGVGLLCHIRDAQETCTGPHTSYVYSALLIPLLTSPFEWPFRETHSRHFDQEKTFIRLRKMRQTSRLIVKK